MIPALLTTTTGSSLPPRFKNRCRQISNSAWNSPTYSVAFTPPDNQRRLYSDETIPCDTLWSLGLCLRFLPTISTASSKSRSPGRSSRRTPGSGRSSPDRHPAAHTYSGTHQKNHAEPQQLSACGGDSRSRNRVEPLQALQQSPREQVKIR